MPTVPASQVADYLIRFSQDHGDPISNLKLQKLLYYAQAWHLALYDKPLFQEKIEAWIHGPAVKSVYRVFKDWSWKPITARPTKPDLPKRVTKHLDEVMEVYGGLSAFDLERLTHSEKPWQKARGNTPKDESSSAIISHDDMRKFYRSMMNANK
jgi:uncharacterized phage-associated protein